jgi:glycosyltransferase involved in cell wall biosynthesis
MIDRRHVLALIPAYREEAHIGDVVRGARRQLEEILVVDDGSRDATAARATEAGARVLRHEINRGKGAALKTGLKTFLEGAWDWALVLDADGQHRPEEIPRFLDAADGTTARILVGNRMEDTAPMPAVRRWSNRFMSWQISRVCGQRIPDSQCGFRMIHRDAAPLLFLDTNAYDYETEMLFVTARQGFRIDSVPVSTVYGDEKSKIHPLRDTLRFLRLVHRYRQSL